MAEREELEKRKLEKTKAEKKGGRIRVGMLTSGGNCQVPSMTVRGIAKTLCNLYDSVDIVGFRDGYRGPMYEDHRLPLKNDFSGILMRGGTLLDTSRQPFEQMTQPDEDGNNKVELMKATYRKLGLDCLCVLGGSGSQKTANLLRQKGLNIVSLPKTIDSDLFGADETFGFWNAVEIVSSAIDCVYATAASHGGVFIVEVIRHKVGWLMLYVGIAGGADIILIPEVPYDIKTIIEALRKRQRADSHFPIIIVTEGAISKETAALNKKEKKTKLVSRRYLSAAYEIDAEIQAITGQKIHVTVPGHTQHDGAPNPYDHMLSSRLDARTTKLTSKDHFGEIVIIRNNEIASTPPEKSADRLKTVGPDSSIVEKAGLLGLSFGDHWNGLCRTLLEVEVEKL